MHANTKSYSPPYKNPLHKPTWIWFQRTNQLHQLIQQVVVWQHGLKKEIQLKSFHMVGDIPITFNDLSSKLAVDKQSNLRVLRPISRKQYLDFIKKITAREIGYGISETYEYFEVFLYDILAVYFKLKHKSYGGLRKQIQIRTKIKNEFRSTNNSKAFEFLRRNCEIYKKYEAHNTTKLNLIDWYVVFSLIRHGITHSAQSVSKNSYLKLSEKQKALFDELIPNKKTKEYIFMQPNYLALRKVIERSSAHAFLIFKGLSEVMSFESFPLFNERITRNVRKKKKA